MSSQSDRWRSCRHQGQMVSLIGLMAAALIGLCLGTDQVSLALVVAAPVVVLLVPQLSLTQWCTVLLLSTIVSRGVVAALDLPPLVNFLHYPLVAAFAVVASQRPQPAYPTAAGIKRWIFGLAGIAVLSMVANGSHPLRALIFLAITSEPLLVLWAVTRWPADVASETKMGKVIAALLTIQIPLAIWQWHRFGWRDPVQGTFIDSGNGAHQLGALLALGILVIVAALLVKRLPLTISILACLVLLGIIILAGANQVVMALAVAMLFIPTALPRIMWNTDGESTKSRSVKLVLASVLLSTIMVGTGIGIMQRVEVSNILRRSERLAQPSRLPEMDLLRERGAADLVQLMLGSGPGVTASRASILLTPEMMKDSSPLAALSLPPTEEGLQLVSAARSQFGGSAESVSSGSLGILGDLGTIGYFGALYLFIGLWRHLGRTGGWLVPAARGAILMTSVLLFIDNWLEYPEYAVPLSILLGFAMVTGQRTTRLRQHSRLKRPE